MALVRDNRLRGIRQTVPAGHLIGRLSGDGKAQLLNGAQLRQLLGPGYVKAIAGSAAPALTDTHIFVGNSSNVATDVAMSGDTTIADTGAVTIGANKVQEAKLDLSDVTTFNVSTSRHGFVPKAPNVATQFLDGTGAFSTPSGGGGTGVNTATLAVKMGGSGAVSFASFGNIITPQANISATGLGLVFTTVTGGTYKFGIAPYNRGTNKITGAPTYAPTYTEAAGAVKSVYANFASPVAMTAGSDYILIMVRTDSTTTVSTNLFFDSANTPAPALFLPTAVSATAMQLASTGPTTGDTWSSGGGGVWSFQMVYSI